MSGPQAPPLKGRGATFNPGNRYRRDTREPFDDGWTEIGDAADADAPPRPRTIVTIQPARTIIARNDSPDVPFNQSINPYQGCEHGCIYCFARPSHAYLDLSPGLDFETRILAKPDAATLLRKELRGPAIAATRSRSAPTPTRTSRSSANGKSRARILEVLAECEHPFTHRDQVGDGGARHRPDRADGGEEHGPRPLSITTLDHELARKLEPRAAAPRRRLEALRRLSDAGDPGGRDDRADHPAAQRS